LIEVKVLKAKVLIPRPDFASHQPGLLKKLRFAIRWEGVYFSGITHSDLVYYDPLWGMFSPGTPKVKSQVQVTT